ncbi:caskin-2-like [Oreochromis niloticus]|uniref:caskin-2-like n=1 Tax=Oreochromis niloticus TaxID=8128 RepID=UPI000904972A|nr:caskin-2-like [Oreochromis niloticus]
MFNSRRSPKQENSPAVLSNPENQMSDTTMSTRSENENSIVVTPEQIMPPITRCFERLSGGQWRLIENGTYDSGVLAVLADMICEIIQIASSSILKNALPDIQDRMTKEDPEPLDAGKISPSLGDSISAAIASALNVPIQQHESADELTLMVEEEISEKVSSTVELITKSPDLPQDPAVYVSGKCSNIKKLHRMVCHAASCLKRSVARKLRCRCVSSGSDSVTESTDSKIVQSAITEISAILSSSSSDGEMTEKEEIELPDESALTEQDKIKPVAESQSIRAPMPVEVVAADIVNEILGNMDSSSEELCERCSLPKPAFNAGLIINKVRDLFSRCLPSTSHSGLKARKHRFSMFAKKQFEKMKKELRQVIKANRKFFVCLKNIFKFHKYETVSSDESSLSGSVPETRPQSKEAHRAPSQNTLLRYMRSSPADFDAIRSDVNQLFDKLTKKEELFIIHKTLDNFRNSGATRDFTVELTGKVFDLLMTDRLYQIPEPLMGRSLSDTVISRTPQIAPGSKRPFSAEVLYVLVEDAVEKFLQKLLLWVENEDQDQMIEDKVSVVVEDIQNFIKRTRTPTKETSTDSDGSGRESVPSPVTRKSGSISPEKSSLSPDQSPVTPRPGSISPEKSSLSPVTPRPGSISPEKSSLSPVTPRPGSISPEKSSQSPVTPRPGSISPEKSSQSPVTPRPGSISPEKSSQSPVTPRPGSISPEKSSQSPVTPRTGSISPEKSSLSPDQSPVTPRPWSISPEKSSQSPVTPRPGSISPENSSQSPVTPRTGSISPEKSSLSPVTPRTGSISPEKSSLSPDQSPVTPRPWSISPEKSSLSPDQSPGTPRPWSISPENSSQSPVTPRPGSISPEKSSQSPVTPRPGSISPEKSSQSPVTPRPGSISPEKSSQSPVTPRPGSISPEKSSQSPVTPRPGSISPEKSSQSPVTPRPGSISPEKSSQSPVTPRPESISPEKSSQSPVTPRPGSISPEKSSQSPVTPRPGSISPEKSSQSPVTPRPGSISPEKSSQSPVTPRPGSISPEKSSQSPVTPRPGSISPEKSSQSPVTPRPGSISPEKSSQSPVTPRPGSISPEKSSLSPDQSPVKPRPGSISPEKSSLSPVTPRPGSISPEKSSLSPDQSPVKPRPESISPEKSSLSPVTARPGSISPQKCSASISRSLKDSSAMSEMRSVSVSSSDAEKISDDLAFFLMMRVIKKSKSKTKESVSLSEELDMVIDRLRDLIQPELSSTESATSLTNNKKKFIKKLAKCLIKEFGSPDNVLKAAIANDSSFDEALIKHLKIRLGVIPSPPKKPKSFRFFSAVGKVLRKPFRWFTKARDD